MFSIIYSISLIGGFTVMKNINNRYYLENDMRLDNYYSKRESKAAVLTIESIYNLKRFILGFALFITILLFSIFSINAFTYAASNEYNSNLVKKYHSVMIYCGDSIESIASSTYNNNVYSSQRQYEKEIRSINHLTDETELIPGNYIVLPYFEYCNSINITIE